MSAPALAPEPARAPAPALSDPRTLRGLGLALIASLLLGQLPYGGFALYPFKIIATWIHELSHGIMMLVTGVGFDRMDLFPDGSGLSYARSLPSPVQEAVIAPAGYMGTPLLGAAMLVAGQRARGARWSLAIVGAAMAACALVVVSNPFGQTAIAVIGAVVLGVALLAPARVAIGAAMLLAGQMCVNAVLDLRVLFRPVMVVDGKIERGSDADAMAETTLGTDSPWGARLWALLWLLWSLALLYAAIRIARRRR
jgi:hypothetical protein